MNMNALKSYKYPSLNPPILITTANFILTTLSYFAICNNSIFTFKNMDNSQKMSYQAGQAKGQAQVILIISWNISVCLFEEI